MTKAVHCIQQISIFYITPKPQKMIKMICSNISRKLSNIISKSEIFAVMVDGTKDILEKRKKEFLFGMETQC